MTTTLTNEEKISIIDLHLKSIDYSLYGLELDLAEANAVLSPDTDLISSITTRKAAATAKRNVLVAEKETLTEGA
jgi:hypothetical protein